MADLAEIKSLFSDTQKTVHDLRADLAETQGKLADFVDADRVKRIEENLAAKLSAEAEAQTKLADRLSDVEAKMGRPGAPVQQPEMSKAFDNYIRKGVEADELKSMATNVGADGGFAVPDGMTAGIAERMRRTSPVRSVANVVSFQGAAYHVLMERGDAGFEWAGETGSRSETDTPTINRISITADELSALPKVSQRMLDDASFDVDRWLTRYVSDRFGRAEATAFVAGDGVNKPKGFLSYSTATDADADRANETLQYRVTGASGAFASSGGGADVLIQTFYDLQAAFQAGASWMMKNTTLAQVATLKDGRGAFLLDRVLNADGTLVQTIMGRPAYQADDMPAIAANSLSIAVGDFTGYTIVDGKIVTVLRDPYSAKPNVLFYVTKRVGGGVTDFDSIKLIKFGTT